MAVQDTRLRHIRGETLALSGFVFRGNRPKIDLKNDQLTIHFREPESGEVVLTYTNASPEMRVEENGWSLTLPGSKTTRSQLPATFYDIFIWCVDALIVPNREWCVGAGQIEFVVSSKG